MTMQQSQWAGVFPAITTPLRDDLSVDHDALAAHVRWLADAGCAGIVTGGSLGEAATLSFDEKVRINETCVRAIDGRIQTKLRDGLREDVCGRGTNGTNAAPAAVLRSSRLVIR